MVITRYETRETQTKTPLESNIKDDEPYSCLPARVTCWEESGKTWQDHILKYERYSVGRWRSYKEIYIIYT
jgi:hypothetical protein